MEILIEQWLSRFDPSTASISALVFFFFFFLSLFIWKLFWPWFTKEYFPLRAKLKQMEVEAKVKAKQDEVTIMSALRDAVVEIKVIFSQQLVSLRQQETQITSILNAQSAFLPYIDNTRLQIVSEIREIVEAKQEQKI
jgi:hypothetical protein